MVNAGNPSVPCRHTASVVHQGDHSCGP